MSDEDLELVDDVSDDAGIDLEEPASDDEQIIEEKEGEFSRRFAVVNLDWDHVKSVDIYHVLSSFVPKTSTGRVLSVTVYPSEYGKECMANEAIHGPPKEIFAVPKPTQETIEEESPKVDEEDEEEIEARIRKELIKEQGSEDFDKKKLRKYQLDQLKYYYAVVECDSTGTAKYIHSQCDGAEYETSGNFFDVRFIPDEMEFDEDEARDRTTQGRENYDPDLFETSALQHSNLRLTWDETDPARIITMRKAFMPEHLDSLDLSNVLGSDSSGNESVAATKRNSRRKKYRNLLKADHTEEDEQPIKKHKESMEVVFQPEDEYKKVHAEEHQDETTMEAYKRKKMERREKRLEKRQAMMAAEQTAKQIEELEEADLGFEDPFFENPGKANKKLVSAPPPEPSAKAETERANLELLLMDDHATDSHQQHFNMAQILKSEKGKKVKGKKKKSKNADEDTTEGLQPGFEPDFSDPRFSAVYQGDQFAIDPNHPRYAKSQTMSKLLGQVRNRNA